MYAIIPLDPAAVQRFEVLAPYELRPLVRGLAGLPQLHAFGATLFGAPVGLAVAAESTSAWEAPSVVRSGDPAGARLLAITVARTHRRMGVGKSLLAAVEHSLARRGISELKCTYALREDTGLGAVESMFREGNWSAPEMTMLQCRADNALLDAPIIRELPPLPREYRLCDWVDVSESERGLIIERQRLKPWYPEDLDPFHFEPELEVMNSLALRYNGDVVGWLLTHSTTPTIIQYRCLFVRPDLARLGRGLSMLRESILRHWRAIAPAQGAGEWSTPASLPLMIRFIRRHLEPFGAVVTEQKVVTKQLDRVAARVDSRANVESPLRAVRETFDDRRPSTHSFLSEDEAESVFSTVMQVRDQWTPRFDTLPCFTLGAAAMFDAWEGPGVYAQRSARGNALLMEHFGALYARLRDALSLALGARAEFEAECALPHFHIQESVRGAHLPLLAIRADTTHTMVHAGEVFDAPPVTFVMCVTQVHAKPLMNFWNVGHASTVGLDSEETARLIETSHRTSLSVSAGSLVSFESDQFHQFAPLRDVSGRTLRILLTGQATLKGGLWRVFS
jgi:GNAT superfamily N-acetyltransferase